MSFIEKFKNFRRKMAQSNTTYKDDKEASKCEKKKKKKTKKERVENTHHETENKLWNPKQEDRPKKYNA